MEQLVTLFADIGGSKSREDNHSAAYLQDLHVKDARETRESRDARERRAREPSRSTKDGSSRRDASRSTRNSIRESRDFRDYREFRESKEFRDYREHRESKELRDHKDHRESREFRDHKDHRDHREQRDREHRESRDSKDVDYYGPRDRELRESRDSKEVDYFGPRDREPRESRDQKESRDSKDVDYFGPRDARSSWDDTEPGPPPYQEVADATLPTPLQTPLDNVEHELPPTHPSGISPTERCVSEPISAPVDWVIHPTAPHFVICGRCYVDRIYPQQWKREFVKYRPSHGMLLRCHLGAIPHMEKRWSRVHTAEDFLSFLKVMQRKKVAKPCPGDTYPRSNITWYTTPAVPGMRICQECRRRLFGGTSHSKHFDAGDTSVSSICHGSFKYTSRMVDELLENDDWDRFVEGMRIRIKLSGCCGQREARNEDDLGWWYKYTRTGVTKDLYICETCYFDYAYGTDQAQYFILGERPATKPLCMASLKENQVPETADIEYSRAEVTRLLHGTDRRCYAQGTVGLKWYTIGDNPQGYGVCEGCYLTKVKPLGGAGYFVHKRDVGKHASFACWMNSYHPFFTRHQQLLQEAMIIGDMNRLAYSISKFLRVPGCQLGGMGQGKNKRWWGWRSLRICMACMKGGNLAETPAAKRFELHGDKDPYFRMCDLYSMQLRDRFNHDDVGRLLEFARKRQEMMT